MKRFQIVAAIAMLFVSGSALAGNNAKRTATITDTNGNEKKAFAIRFSSRYVRHFPSPLNRLAITAGKLQIAIPMDTVVSIQRTNKPRRGDYLVKYMWQGAENTVSGSLTPGIFEGKADRPKGGAVVMATRVVKSLVFDKTPPGLPKVEKDKLAKRRAGGQFRIALKEGTEITGAGLLRVFRYSSTAGLLIGNRTRYRTSDDIGCTSNGKFTTYPIAKINRIHFGKKGAVTIALKDKQIVQGKLAPGGRPAVFGFYCLSDRGELFIRSADIVSVEASDRSSP